MDILIGAIGRASEQLDSANVNWLLILLGGALGTSFFESYVNWRQLDYLKRATIPQEVAGLVDEKTFKKGNAYSAAKLRYSFLTKAYFLTWTAVTYIAHLYPAYYSVARRAASMTGVRLFSGSFAVDVLFVVISVLVNTCVSVPVEWYRTFVLEEAHGFNKSTQKLFAADQVKSILIESVVSGLFFSLLVKVIEWAGPVFFVYATVMVLLFILIFMVLGPLLIQPLFNKFTPLEDGELRSSVNKLAADVGFPVKRVYVTDGSKRSSHSNAYFTGLPWYKQIVIFDTLIEQCSVEQITAILGHELGHWRLNHIGKNLMIFSGLAATAFTAFAVVLNNNSLYQSVGFEKYDQPLLARLYIFFEVAGLANVFLTFFSHSISRHFEFEADKFAVKLGFGQALAESLVILNNENLGDVATDKLYSAYTRSHPSLPERLSAIRAEIVVFGRKND